MGLLQILKQTVKIFAHAWKMMLSITLLTLFPLSLLTRVYTNGATTLTKNLDSNISLLLTIDSNSPEVSDLLAAILQEASNLLGIKAVAFVSSFIVSWVFSMSTVYAAAAAYSDEPFTLREVLARIKRNWKGPLLTQLAVRVLYFVYNCLRTTTVLALLVFLLKGLSWLLIAGLVKGLSWLLIAGLVLLVLVFLSSYMSALSILSAVVSVIEKDCYGFRAIGRAAEVMHGRKKVAYMLAFLTFLCLRAAVAAKANGSLRLGLAMLVMSSLGDVLSVFLFVAFTVFYYDSVEGNRDAEGKMMGYQRLEVAAALP